MNNFEVENNISESSVVAPQAPEISVKEFSRDVEIPAVQLSPALKNALIISLNVLKALKDEISGKIEFAWKRDAALEARMERLMRLTGSANEKRQRVMGESVAMYTSLLRGVIAEIDEELMFFSPFTQDEHPFVVNVPFGASHQSSTIFFENSVKLLKSQAKNIHKYLLVSYSRYLYGFDLQEKSIEQLEYRFASLIEHKEQQSIA